jgi:phospholipid/cholesterol/gamma-HCH transport system ATP-binding protein
LAEKLADRVLFLHEARAVFFGTIAEMKVSEEPIIKQFLELDLFTLADLAKPRDENGFPMQE